LKARLELGSRQRTPETQESPHNYPQEILRLEETHENTQKSPETST
jgi:hypothetical protein